MILGLNGLIGSGKGAVSEYLQTKYAFQHVSFADSLKHAVAGVFCWPEELLQGKTEESREWREKIDYWWSERLHIKGLTPRWVLQQWGTEVCRHGFHPDIWVASLERKLLDASGNVVVDDCRFHNEMNAIRAQDGILIRVKRGKNPEWYLTALTELQQIEAYGIESGFESAMARLYPGVHISEWGWINENFDYEIENDGSLENLHQKIDELVKQISK